MDRELRRLERHYLSTGSKGSLDQFLRGLLRQSSMEALELEAEDPESVAAQYIQQLRELTEAGDPYDEVFLNLYEDFTAKTTILCSLTEVTGIRRFLRNYYTDAKLFYQGVDYEPEDYAPIVDPFDDVLGPIQYYESPTSDPAAEIVINYSKSSCFRLWPGEILSRLAEQGISEGTPHDPETWTPLIIRQASPVNLHGNTDRLVSLRILDFDDVESEPATHPVACWINAYNIGQRFGGQEEGGWWYDTGEPLASVYVGMLDVDEDNIELSTLEGYPHVDDMFEYLQWMFNTDTKPINLSLEAHPALATPYSRPYYD
jgi:hypothetical protein